MSDIPNQIHAAGVSIWLDDLSRERLANGSLKNLIDQGVIRGVTTNPSIFNNAISNSDLYVDNIKSMSDESIDEIISTLTCDDVSKACDLFSGLYQQSNGEDGRVSIEVDPRFARDIKATVDQGIYLWGMINKQNLLIKVPATKEGLPAITALIGKGISVNVTLIFSLQRYREVLAAYADGLEVAVSNNVDITKVFSVASFFISRIDTEVDKLLPSESELRGTCAIANAILAYQYFTEFTKSTRWKSLQEQGANLQRPLWASTGVKDPAYDPTRYVMQLIAPECVNTMPEATLNQVMHNGVFAGNTITSNFQHAKSIMAKIALAGIDLDRITLFLEVDGVSKFESAWFELIDSVRVIAGK
jgi:transaldolase